MNCKRDSPQERQIYFTEVEEMFSIYVGELATVRQCEEVVEQLAAISLDKPRLWKFAASISLSEADLIRLGDHGKTMGLRCQTALVASNDLIYAMARQHMVYRLDKPELMSLFRVEADALAWFRGETS